MFHGGEVESDPNDGYAFRVGGQRLQVMGIGGEDGSPRFSERHNQCIDSGATAGQSAQHCGSTRKCLGHDFRDVACLEEPVLHGVATRMTLQTFNKNNREHSGWPKTLVTQRQDQSERPLGPLGEAADAARIEDQHQD